MKKHALTIILVIIGIGCLAYFTIPNLQDLISPEETTVSQSASKLSKYGRPKGEIFTQSKRKRRHTFRSLYREKTESTFDTVNKWVQLIIQVIGSIGPLLGGGFAWKKWKGTDTT